MITQNDPGGDLRRLSPVGRVRRWSLWSLPRLALSYILIVELVTVCLMTAALRDTRLSLLDLGRFAVLGGVAVLYAEGANRLEQSKRYLGHERIWSNHTSVWAFAGVLVLPGAYAAVLVVLVYAQHLLHGYRYHSVRPYRTVFTTATMVLATLAAAAVLHLGVGGGLGDSGLPAALTILAAAVIFPMLNLGVLLGGMALATKPARIMSLFPDRNTLGFEATTLVLGLLTAEVVLHTLWLTPVVLVVFAGLHRSSLVKGLQVAASIDVKTGLLNSATWQDRARQGLSRSARAHQPVAVVMIDLDHFKDVNDTHGHLAGDKVLCEVADALRVELRGHDLLGRFGGEEFVAFLEGPTLEHATDISERLRQRIATLTTIDALVVTGSVGLAHCTQARNTSLEDLLHMADIALCKAKSAGRNRVDIAHVDAQTPGRARQ